MSKVKLNDVIIAVDNLDSQETTFEKIIEKFKFVTPEGDWCGLQAASVNRTSSYIKAADGLKPVNFLQVTTEEQDLVASYPVSLSRVEDVLCIILARPLIVS